MVEKGGCAGVSPDTDVCLRVVSQNAGITLLLHGDELIGPLPLADMLLPQLSGLFPHLHRAGKGPQGGFHLWRGQMPEAQEDQNTNQW